MMLDFQTTPLSTLLWLSKRQSLTRKTLLSGLFSYSQKASLLKLSLWKQPLSACIRIRSQFR